MWPNAGVKDSALTIHGNLQAERLGKYLAESGVRFKKIYSSDLQRAFKTATAIRLAQPRLGSDAAPETKLQVTALPVLREQDFGFYEGKPFYARPRESQKSGKEYHRAQHHDDPDFKDVESKESMALRMSTFLQDHLAPAITSEQAGLDSDIVVVSHGIILSQLWKCLLKLVARNSIALSPGLSVGAGGSTPLEYLGGWSNTGYLELEILKKETAATTELAVSTAAPPIPNPSNADGDACPQLHQYKIIIKAINGKEHLKEIHRVILQEDENVTAFRRQ
ncbi:histidine phosphatase superfamily [Usnea florida]